MIPVWCSTSWAIRPTGSWSLMWIYHASTVLYQLSYQANWELVNKWIYDTSTVLYQLSYQANWELVSKWIYDTSTVLYQLSYQANSELAIKWVYDTRTVHYQLSYQAKWERVIRWVLDDSWKVESDAQCVWNSYTFCTAEWTTRFDVTTANFWALLSSCKRRPEHLCPEWVLNPKLCNYTAAVLN